MLVACFEKIRKAGLHTAWIVSVPFLFLGLGDSAFAQHLGKGAGDEVSIWRIVAALLFCVVVAIAAALFLKHRIGGGGARFLVRQKSSRLEILEILRARPQMDLCIVACDGEELLMALSPQGVSLLCRLPRAAPRASTGDAGP